MRRQVRSRRLHARFSPRSMSQEEEVISIRGTSKRQTLVPDRNYRGNIGKSCVPAIVKEVTVCESLPQRRGVIEMPCRVSPGEPCRKNISYFPLVVCCANSRRLR